MLSRKTHFHFHKSAASSPSKSSKCFTETHQLVQTTLFLKNKFHERVHNCGHYNRNLIQACKDAKKSRRVCSTGTKTSSNTTGLTGCGLPGCNREASLMREGPGSYIAPLAHKTIDLWQVAGPTADLMNLRSTGVTFKKNLASLEFHSPLNDSPKKRLLVCSHANTIVHSFH